MPRPPRCRFIDGYPEYWRFTPLGADRVEVLVMTLDEYETIRLIDKCGLTQELCASRMGVARMTVTAIYDSARKKLADSLVDGKTLQIGGGHYRLNSQGTDHVIPKGENDLRIAVAVIRTFSLTCRTAVPVHMRLQWQNAFCLVSWMAYLMEQLTKILRRCFLMSSETRLSLRPLLVPHSSASHG